MVSDDLVTGPRLRRSIKDALNAWAEAHGMSANQAAHQAVVLYLKTEGGEQVPELPGFERDVLRVLRNALDALDLAGTGLNPSTRERISTQLAAMAELASQADRQ